MKITFHFWYLIPLVVAALSAYAACTTSPSDRDDLNRWSAFFGLFLLFGALPLLAGLAAQYLP